jgi:hypothetical protein
LVAYVDVVIVDITVVVTLFIFSIRKHCGMHILLKRCNHTSPLLPALLLGITVTTATTTTTTSVTNNNPTSIAHSRANKIH